MGQLILQVGGVALKQRKFHHGKLRLKLREYIRQQGQSAGMGDPQAQQAHIMAVDVPHLGQILAVKIQDLGGSLHQQVPRIGQGQLGGTGEQLHIQLLFHVADVVAQRLLGDVQPLRGPRDIQFLCHKQEIFQMEKIHSGPPYDFECYPSFWLG